MSKMLREKKKEKRIRLPAEYSEGTLHFKTGLGWKASNLEQRRRKRAEREEK